MTEQEQPKNDFMHKLALQIVERRNLVFLIVILGTIFTIFSRSWVKVESDLTTYLPKTSETRMGLDIMEKEFTTYGSADVMVANITPDEADQLNDELAGLRGIQMIEYDDTTAHYNNVSALYSITFDYPEDDDQCLETLESVKEYLKDYDIYVSTSLGNTQEETIEREVNVIMVYVAIIIVVVLIFTSQTYAEVPVLLLTFVVGMILNMGTNFLLGTISFVSNSVTNILQLALSLDYAIIFCNHFKEEHETLPLKEAVIESLAKSIPEISSSSLTTIGGLVAMLFMQFKIGPDMAICLIKAILFSMLPGFIMQQSEAYNVLIDAMAAAPIPSALGFLLISILIVGLAGNAAVVLLGGIATAAFIPAGLSAQACGVILIYATVVLDSLPNNLGIITQCEIMDCKMKECYPSIFRTTVLLTAALSLVVALCAMIGLI